MPLCCASCPDERQAAVGTQGRRSKIPGVTSPPGSSSVWYRVCSLARSRSSPPPGCCHDARRMAEVAVDTPVVILCGGRGNAAAGAHAVDPQAAGRDRRPADRLARDPDLRRPGLPALRACTGYKGELIERFGAEHEWPEGVDVDCVDTGLDTPTGGRIALREQRSRARALLRDLRRRRGRHRPGRAARLPPRPRRPGHDDRRAARAAVRRHRARRRRPRARASARSRAPSTGSTAASSASSRGVFDYLDRASVLEREPLERLAADGPAARLPPRRASGTAWTPTRTRCAQRPVGARAARLEASGRERRASS